MTHMWDAGSTPYLRADRGQLMRFSCPFCGDTDAILSFGDDRHDPARIELYCENQDCDAREIVILVRRDGTNETAERADVRALRAIDNGPTEPDEGRVQSFPRFPGNARITPEAIRARRQNTATVTLHLVGLADRFPDDEDEADDDGR